MDTKKRKVEENGAGSVGVAVVDLTKEDVKKLIEPFNKEQLMEILQDAAIRHIDVLEEIRKLADKDPAHRKIFVRGLGWDTTSDTLKSVFSSFGEVEEGAVIMDKTTGKSRGFGFVTFRHMDGAQRALKESSKRIDGRMTVCQLAATGAPPHAPVQEVATRKIYVGNVPTELSAERLLQLFTQYGEIEEGPLGYDKSTGRSRGFALIIYKSAESAKRSLQEPIKTIDGQQMYCKLAVDGQKPRGGISAQSGKGDGSDALKGGLPYGSHQSGVVGGGGSLQYGSSHQGLISTGLPMNQGQGLGQMNGGLNSSLNPSLHTGLSGHNQSLASLNPSLSSSHHSLGHQGLSQGAGQPLQVPTSLGMASYGTHVGISAYGSQPPMYNGQPTSYYSMGGMSSYGQANSTVGQAAALQNPAGGHYQFAAYGNSQLAVTTTPRTSTAGSLPSYYNL